MFVCRVVLAQLQGVYKYKAFTIYEECAHMD